MKRFGGVFLVLSILVNLGLPVRTAQAIPGPQSYFLSQFPYDAPKRVRMHNEDCGPTCLSMALWRWNKLPSSIDPRHIESEKLISTVRRTMTGTANHQKGTTVESLAKGATKLGLRAIVVQKLMQNNLAALNQQLSQGRMVVAVGNPMARGAYGNRMTKNDYCKDNTMHFILVTGKDAAGRYVVNDPLSLKSTIWVAPREMHSYLAADAPGWGVALWP